MKCSSVSKMYGLPKTDRRYAEVQAHLCRCFMCRARWDDQSAIQRLIGLKRYEQPAPDLEARSLAAIHRRLSAQPEPAGWWRTAWAGWLVEGFQPARLAWATAAAVGLLAGIFYLTQLAGPVHPARPTPTLAADGQIQIKPPDTAPLPLPGMPPIVVASSNREPARMDYGPGATVPVNYPY